MAPKNNNTPKLEFLSNISNLLNGEKEVLNYDLMEVCYSFFILCILFICIINT